MEDGVKIREYWGPSKEYILEDFKSNNLTFLYYKLLILELIYNILLQIIYIFYLSNIKISKLYINYYRFTFCPIQ
jgi:hypothetical protein